MIVEEDEMFGFNEYGPTLIDGRMCIWLQSIGWHAAKPVGQVGVGDLLVYNFGSTGRVVAVEPSKTGATVVLSVEERGKTYRSKARRATTLVAVRNADYRP